MGRKKAARNRKGCGLCKQYKRAGNAPERKHANERRKLQESIDEMKDGIKIKNVVKFLHLAKVTHGPPEI